MKQRKREKYDVGKKAVDILEVNIVVYVVAYMYSRRLRS